MKFYVFVTLFFITIIPAFGQQSGFTQSDRELLIKMNVKLEEFEKRLDSYDKRFEDFNTRLNDVNNRINDINNRLDDVNNRLDDMNNRVDDLATFVQVLAGVFGAMFLGMMGIIFWDRSTMVNKAKRSTIDEIEKEGKVKDLISALRELAKEDEKVRKVLQQFNLM